MKPMTREEYNAGNWLIVSYEDARNIYANPDYKFTADDIPLEVISDMYVCTGHGYVVLKGEYIGCYRIVL